MITLWTIQSEAAWCTAQQHGILQADGRRVWRHFRPSYHWMMDQMRKRIPKYTGRFPLWAWEHKVDLRSTHLLPTGSRGVRIQFEVSERHILRSNFEHWHAVLNNSFLCLSEDEWDQWAQAGYPQEDAQRSWERIFDPKLTHTEIKTSKHTKHSNIVQVVLERIPLEQVRHVQHFVAR